MQDRLLQELVDHGIDENTQMTAEITERLGFLTSISKRLNADITRLSSPNALRRSTWFCPGGYKLPKDVIVIPALHHIHNNPAIWDNPSRFSPDRWDTPEVKNRHKAAYVPFATGPRMCIGFNFALQEIKIFLPKLIYRYKFIREGDGTIEYDPMFQLIRSNNLYVRAERRAKWPPKTTATV